MNRLLDTNVCIDVLRGREEVVRRLRGCDPRDCFISTVTEFELLQGTLRAPVDRQTEEKEKVTRLVSLLQVLPFDSECARIAAELNAGLLNAGKPRNITDVFIAATGISLGWTVVTSNTKDFADLPGLDLENWR